VDQGICIEGSGSLISLVAEDCGLRGRVELVTNRDQDSNLSPVSVFDAVHSDPLFRVLRFGTLGDGRGESSIAVLLVDLQYEILERQGMGEHCNLCRLKEHNSVGEPLQNSKLSSVVRHAEWQLSLAVGQSTRVLLSPPAGAWLYESNANPRLASGATLSRPLCGLSSRANCAG
jgi:hypothetical protein